MHDVGSLHFRQVLAKAPMQMKLWRSDFVPNDKSAKKNSRLGDKHNSLRYYLLHVSWNQCDHNGRFIALWATFQSLSQQLFFPNSPHFYSFFQIFHFSSEIIFGLTLVNIWRLFTGHAAWNRTF